MNFKKTIAKSLVVAMALGMVPVANLQTAKAAAANLTFSGETGIAKSTDAKFWGIAKENAKGTFVKDGKKYNITNIQELAGEIDVYAALKGKAGILVVGVKPVPDADWTMLNIPAADNTFKAQFIATTGAIKGTAFKPTKALGGDFGYLFATTGKKGKETEINLATSAAAIEVKLNDGSWQTFQAFIGAAPTNDLVNTKLHALGQSGSTLSFRIKGTDTAWASKESKLKIATQAKAPAVKVDLTKEIANLKKGAQWQLVAIGAAAVEADWNLVEDSKGVSFAKLGLTDSVTDAKDLLVRTAADSKKIASKVGRVTLNAPANVGTGANALTLGTGNPAKIESTGSAVKLGAKELATVETSLAYDVTKGATITNKSANDIEYALVTTGVDSFKWSTLKASKDPEKKPTKASLKYSKDAKANTWTDGGKTKLYVRLAGTKQDKNNVATRSGVSVGAVLAFAPIKQTFALSSGTSSSAADGAVTITSTKAAVTVATGKAVTFTIKAKVDKLVNAKGGTPKLTAIAKLPSGVTIKAGKITNAATGEFDITLNVSNKAFKEDTISATAKYKVKYEGVDEEFEITFAKK